MKQRLLIAKARRVRTRFALQKRIPCCCCCCCLKHLGYREKVNLSSLIASQNIIQSFPYNNRLKTPNETNSLELNETELDRAKLYIS